MNSFFLKIVSSKAFARLKGKTQLFSPTDNDHYTNRMTHSLQVYGIAQKIATGIENKYSGTTIDEKLLCAIALTHDIGHTPFGHEGERTLNAILSGKDDLGGLIPQFPKKEMRRGFMTDKEALGFKHNIFSGKLYLRTFDKAGYDDFQASVIDGIFKHTKPYWKDEKTGDPDLTLDYDFQLIIDRFEKLGENPLYATAEDPITLEGEIVKLSDEIAQRCSDFSDAVVANILKLEEFHEAMSKIANYFRRKDLDIKSVRESIETYLLKQIEYKKPETSDGDKGHVSLSEEGKKFNDAVDNYIKNKIRSSYLIRSTDAKNKHIIRQVFKAFYRNPEQMDDEAIYYIHQDLQNGEAIRKNDYILPEYDCLEDNQSKDEKGKIDAKELCAMIKAACENVREGRLDGQTEIDGRKPDEKESALQKTSLRVYVVFLFNIAYYIACMTDSYIMRKYDKLYNGGTD